MQAFNLHQFWTNCLGYFGTRFLLLIALFWTLIHPISSNGSDDMGFGDGDTSLMFWSDISRYCKHRALIFWCWILLDCTFSMCPGSSRSDHSLFKTSFAIIPSCFGAISQGTMDVVLSFFDAEYYLIVPFQCAQDCLDQTIHCWEPALPSFPSSSPNYINKQIKIHVLESRQTFYFNIIA